MRLLYNSNFSFQEYLYAITNSRHVIKKKHKKPFVNFNCYENIFFPGKHYWITSNIDKFQLDEFICINNDFFFFMREEIKKTNIHRNFKYQWEHDKRILIYKDMFSLYEKKILFLKELYSKNIELILDSTVVSVLKINQKSVTKNTKVFYDTNFLYFLNKSKENLIIYSLI